MFCLHPLQPARPLFAYSVLYGSSSDIFSRFFAVRIQNLRDFEFQNNHTDTKNDFFIYDEIAVQFEDYAQKKEDALTL